MFSAKKSSSISKKLVNKIHNFNNLSNKDKRIVERDVALFCLELIAKVNEKKMSLQDAATSMTEYFFHVDFNPSLKKAFFISKELKLQKHYFSSKERAVLWEQLNEYLKKVAGIDD